MIIRSSETVPEDPAVATRSGWEGLHVWWLLDRTVGVDSVVFNTTVFPPRIWHELHRHPHADEVLYVVSGQGLHLSEGEPVRQKAGDVVFIPAGEWHGFANDGDEPITVVAVFPGVGGYEDCGYEVHPGDAPAGAPS